MMDVPVLFLLITRRQASVKARKIGWKFNPLADPRQVVEFACGIPHLLMGEFGEMSAPASTPIHCASRGGRRRIKKTGRWLCRPVRIHCSDRLLRRGLD
jgi:hypothetical protein